MDDLQVERLDHLGIISGVIKDLGIIERIDDRIVPDVEEEISTGESVAGMILNGLGFTQRPLSLTPQFFVHKPLDRLFRPGVQAAHFNRFKLGRSLDKIFTYGCDTLFSELSLSACQQEKVDRRFRHVDTTTFSLSGDYVPETDEQAIMITHGYSKDHRPDLKQAVLELMTTQDGGIPLVSQSWDGNASDSAIFQARAEGLIDEFKATPTPSFMVADSKLYTEKKAPFLAQVPFLTRIPETLQVAQQVIEQAWAWNHWQSQDENYRFQRIDLCHYGIEQRWLILTSQSGWHQAEAAVAKAQEKEQKAIQKQLYHFHAQRFSSEKQAQKALDRLVRKWTYHQVDQITSTSHTRYAHKGRPTTETPIKSIDWQLQITVMADPEKRRKQQQRKASFVLGTSIDSEGLNDEDLLPGYKGQGTAERGFRFLKDPLFFTASLFVKKPSRIQGLLMVMTLALLVYSIAQRRMRQQLAQQKETLPNQIGRPTATPTLRWIFQLLEGINVVTVVLQRQVQVVIEGLTDLRKKILLLFGQKVCQIYQIPYTSACSM
jgi:transposase